MKTRLLLFVFISIPLTAAERTLELDPVRTTITFKLGDVLHTVQGSFKLNRGSLRFDAATGKSSGQIVVDVASGYSGSGARDKRMHKEILESSRYPEAIFSADHVSGELASRGESQVDIHGLFQIHGASHEMTLHFRADVTEDEVVCNTAFVIPYVQWGMKNPSNFLLRVNDKVEVIVRTTGRLQ